MPFLPEFSRSKNPLPIFLSNVKINICTFLFYKKSVREKVNFFEISKGRLFLTEWSCGYPVDTGTSWTSSERLMYVQFTSCVYGDVTHFSAGIPKNNFWKTLNKLSVMRCNFSSVADPHSATLLILHSRSSPQEVFLWKGALKKSCNLQDNTHAEVWFQ